MDECLKSSLNGLDLSQDVPPGFKSGFVTLWGRPNVGKSALLNLLVGEKVAIVSPKPQTTRNRILGIVELETAQIIFVDTPGMHEPKHKLGTFLVDEAMAQLPDADVIVFVVDVSISPTPEDKLAANKIKHSKAPVILALNKRDLVKPDVLAEHSLQYASLGEFEYIIDISATRGDNVGKLVEKIVELLPEGPRYYPKGTITEMPEKFMLAELIRESVLHNLHQEVPHCIAVLVERFEERPGGKAYIAATIHVEKESQKKIVIGKGGTMIKRIGQDARLSIEQYLGKPVFLELWVKVTEDWRRDEQALRRFGYYVKPR
ncbi:MAG: GTPase Era [Armatimonadota bacterium]|nr:GTPase Era [Armatimonadota bacterium]MDW8025530.1 GTPase Era [Armatimonadota bacterium]